MKIAKIHFLVVPRFGLFWSVKYLNFEQKLLIQTAHHIFLENRHPEVTENPNCVLSPKWSQKKVSANGLITVQSCLYSLFQNQHPLPPTFCCPLFSEIYLNSQVRINKIVNKRTANYWFSYFYGLLRALSLQPEPFLDFLLNLYIPPWLQKSFKFIVVRLPEIH